MAKIFRPLPPNEMFKLQGKLYKLVTTPILYGAEAFIYRVKKKEGKHYMLKIMHNELNDDDEILDTKKRFSHTLKNINKVKHSNIVKILCGGMELPNYQKQANFGTYPYFLMEYFPAKTLFHSVRALQLHEKLKVLKQISDALSYLHRKGLVFRDLNFYNILVSKKGMVKLCDHTSILWDESVRGCFFPGQACTWVPEIEKHSSTNKKIPYSPASDVYSFGLLIYKLLLNLDTSFFRNEYKEYGILPFHNSPKILRTLLERTLSEEPDERPSIHEVFETICQIEQLFCSVIE